MSLTRTFMITITTSTKQKSGSMILKNSSTTFLFEESFIQSAHSFEAIWSLKKKKSNSKEKKCPWIALVGIFGPLCICEE